jgi:hypothetical protein
VSVVASTGQLVDLLKGIDAIGAVYDEVQFDIDRDVAMPGALDAEGRVNVWEISVHTEQFNDGSDGMLRDEIEYEIMAHYYREAGSRMVFVEALRDAAQAIMGTMAQGGFTNIKPPGVVMREAPVLAEYRTGHECYRARLAFRLWDDEGGLAP